jgi:hypothetical protein
VAGLDPVAQIGRSSPRLPIQGEKRRFSAESGPKKPLYGADAW